MDSQGAYTVLLAEDDLGHARLIERNLRRSGLGNAMVHVSNGQEALDFVERYLSTEVTGGAPPLLILLDLNMPVLDGFEVLRALKAREDTREIPIVVLTTTDLADQVDRCYELGCNAFITKPVEYDEFSESVRHLGKFLSTVTVPHA